MTASTTAPETAPRNRQRAWIVCAALAALAAAAWILPDNPEEDAALWRTYRQRDVLVAAALTVAAAAAAYVLLGAGDRRRRAFRVIAASFAGGACLALLELPAVLLGHDWSALFGTDPSSTWLQVTSGINRPDPELIHIHRPNDVWEGSVRGNLDVLGLPGDRRYPVSVRYDRNGFRNDADLDAAEVVVIGDSFVEAAILPRERTVCAALERSLGTTVANLGQEAYGLRQEVAVLRRFGIPLRPRLVVWFVYAGNDLRDVADHEEALQAVGTGPPPRPLRRRLFHHNALLALSEATTPPLREPSPRALSQSGLFTAADGTRERVYFGDGPDRYGAHSLDVARETLSEAERLCRDAGATFVVVYVTGKFRVYRKHVEIAEGAAAAGWDPGDLPEVLAAWAAERRTPFVDPTAAMETEVAAGRHTYLVDDVHWNEHGHEIAAREVVAALAKLGWKPAGATVR